MKTYMTTLIGLFAATALGHSLNHPTQIQNDRMVDNRLVTPSNSYEYAQAPSSLREREDIKLIQTMLLKRGYNVGGVDGRFGEKTRNALINYQVDNKLNITGKPDSSTLESLEISSPDDQLYSE